MEGQEKVEPIISGFVVMIDTVYFMSDELCTMEQLAQL
jgi:hypothetical protein